MQKVNIPIGFAKHIVKERLEAVFITYIKIRQIGRFYQFNYKDLRTKLKMPDSTIRRHVAELKRLGLIKLEGKTMVAIGCNKLKKYCTQREDFKIVPVEIRKKSLCAKYILIRSEYRKQQFNQDAITKYSRLMDDKNISIKKKKKTRKLINNRSTFNQSGSLVTEPRKSYIGFSHNKVAEYISRCKSTSIKLSKELVNEGVMEIKKVFDKSHRRFTEQEFKYLKKLGEIPHFSRLYRGYIYIQRYNEYSLKDNQYSRI
jgi:hypothetical protein